MGNGDGTFAPPITESLFSVPDQSGYAPLVANASAVVGDLYDDGKLDLITWGMPTCGISGQHFHPAEQRRRHLSTRRDRDQPNQLQSSTIADLNGDGRPDLILPNPGNGTITTLLNNVDGTFSAAGQVITGTQDTPLVTDVNGDGTADEHEVHGHGNILYRQGNPQAPGSFLPPLIINSGFPSRDIAWVPDTPEGALLASIDAHDNAVSLYAYRNGGFVRVGSLSTGQIPAQIVAADLNRDGWDDLVVRNAGDGTLSVFLNNGLGSFWSGFDKPFRPPMTIPLGPGVSDLAAIDTTGDGSPDLVITNALSGQVSVLLNQGNGTFAPAVPYRAGISPSGFDTSSGTLQITSQESTAAVGSVMLAPANPISLVTADPGSSTLDLLQGKGGLMKTDHFELGSGLLNLGNLFRYSRGRKDRVVTDGAARHGSYRAGSSRVSQPEAGACTSVRDKPGSLEKEIQVVAGGAQSFPGGTDVWDLRRSRERWRTKAEALEQEANELRTRLKQRVEPSPPALS